MRGLSCVLLVLVAFGAESWLAKALPTTALVVRSPRQASSPFGDLTSNDTGVSLVLEPSAPWENFIMPSPTVIALLGQLMVISGKVDFSLVPSAPKDGFKYMRHPESFRASLVQVSNDGWEAFMNAHKNMDKIQLYMQQVPAQVKTAVKILTQASPKLVERLLPITLSQIQQMGRTCVDLSAETEGKFANVMLLLGELLATSVTSQGQHQEQLAEVQVELNVTAEQKKILDQLGEQLKKRQAEIDQEVKRRREQYDEALSQIPTGWNAIFQDLGRAIVGVVNAIPSVLEVGLQAGMAGMGGPEAIGFEKASSLGLLSNFFDSMGKMKDTVASVFGGKKTSGSPETMVPAFDKLLQTYENMFKGSPSEVSGEAIDLVNKGKTISGNLGKIMKDFPAKAINQSDQNTIMQGFDDLLKKLKPYVAQSAAASGGTSTGQEAPSSGSSSGMSCTGCNEKYKADVARAALKDAEARQDQVFSETMKYYDQMKELVGKLAKLNLEEINFKDILELLKQGIQLLGKIREQWSKLVQFFTLVSVRAEVALNQTLTPFIEYAKQAEEQIGEGDLSKEDREFYLGLLKDQAVDINRVAYFLYTLSSTYVDVSSKYLLNRLAGLAQMLSTDNEQQRHQLLEGLQKDANEAQDAIKNMAQQRREDYSRLLDARKRELDQISENLGPSSPDDAKAIESAYGKQK